MNDLKEYYSSEQINNARINTRLLHDLHSEKTIEFIEKILDVNYATFRMWYSGGSDYFNNKLTQIANLYEVSVDDLISSNATFF